MVFALWILVGARSVPLRGPPPSFVGHPGKKEKKRDQKKKAQQYLFLPRCVCRLAALARFFHKRKGHAPGRSRAFLDCVSARCLFLGTRENSQVQTKRSKEVAKNAGKRAPKGANQSKEGRRQQRRSQRPNNKKEGRKEAFGIARLVVVALFPAESAVSPTHPSASTDNEKKEREKQSRRHRNTTTTERRTKRVNQKKATRQPQSSFFFPGER